MGEVIKLPEVDSIIYEIDNDNEIFIVSSNKNKLEIGFDGDTPIINLGGDYSTCDRKHLAELLWAAAYLVDSHGVWRKDKYPARNYDDGICKLCEGQILPNQKHQNSIHEECIEKGK